MQAKSLLINLKLAIRLSITRGYVVGINRYEKQLL